MAKGCRADRDCVEYWRTDFSAASHWKLVRLLSARIPGYLRMVFHADGVARCKNASRPQTSRSLSPVRLRSSRRYGWVSGVWHAAQIDFSLTFSLAADDPSAVDAARDRAGTGHHSAVYLGIGAPHSGQVPLVLPVRSYPHFQQRSLAAGRYWRYTCNSRRKRRTNRRAGRMAVMTTPIQ